jgi:hypothetical protein
MNFEQDLFDSFDASTGFDSDNYDMFDGYGTPTGNGQKQVVAVAKKESLVNLNVVNNSGKVQTLELFNFLSSVTKIKNTTTNSSGLKPITGSNFNAANANDKIYFDENGSLIYNEGGSLMTTSSSTGASYRALFEMSGIANFMIRMIRINASTEAQLNNSIYHFQKTALGAFKQNEISPRTYFAPTQYQNKIVDIKQPLAIDSEYGIFYDVNNGETLSLQLFLRKVERATNLGNK